MDTDPEVVTNLAERYKTALEVMFTEEQSRLYHTSPEFRASAHQLVVLLGVVLDHYQQQAEEAKDRYDAAMAMLLRTTPAITLDGEEAKALLGLIEKGRAKRA